jgi:4-diphosphocytidyl-2-C-methyl-D-erythritol kinase
MTSRTQRSYTRITLGLDIIRKLTGGYYAGYHELAIVKHQIDLFDTITIERARSMKITCNDPKTPTDATNLCWQAAEAVRREFGVADNVHIHIEKRIPVQGGLAGGSANAATVLALLGAMWELESDIPVMMRLGRDIGMDVPYYFLGATALDTEATGALEPVKTSCTFHFVLCLPDFGVSTKEAYGNIDYRQTAKQRDKTETLIQALRKDDCQKACRGMHNDFELSVFLRHPELPVIKGQLLDKGCSAAFLSGSGSTMIGVAQSREHAEEVGASISGRCIIASTLQKRHAANGS